MRIKNNIKNYLLIFSQWTRKSYAVFHSIGKMVKISQLNFDMHQKYFVVLLTKFSDEEPLFRGHENLWQLQNLKTIPVYNENKKGLVRNELAFCYS